MLLLATGISVRMLNRVLKEKAAKKQPGCTWIEVDNEVHIFLVEYQDHPQLIEIHAKLQRLLGLMHDAGTCLVQNLFCEMWRRKGSSFVSPQRETVDCIWAHQHSSCYFFLNKKKSTDL
jgi:hypothetical protein